MNRHWQFLLVLSLCAGLRAPAQHNAKDINNPWELRKDEAGIKVYGRTGDSSRFDEIRVTTILPGKLSSLAALILDIGNYPNWSFNSEKAYVLRRIGPAELYFYSLVHSPWPASNRDLAVHLRIHQDSSTRRLFIDADELPNFTPVNKGVVRVPLSVERWIVTPLPGNRIEINYQLRLDPGASAPPWLINLFSTKGPYETFNHLREQLKQPKYHDATLPFITN